MTDSEYYSECCFAHVRHSSEEKRKEEVAKFDSMCKRFLKQFDNKNKAGTYENF